MSNPIFNGLFKQQPTVPQSNPLMNFASMFSQFNNFASTFKGDPREKVQELVNSGQLTQQQIEQLTPLARQLQGMFFKR